MVRTALSEKLKLITPAPLHKNGDLEASNTQIIAELTVYAELHLTSDRIVQGKVTDSCARKL